MTKFKNSNATFSVILNTVQCRKRKVKKLHKTDWFFSPSFRNFGNGFLVSRKHEVAFACNNGQNRMVANGYSFSMFFVYFSFFLTFYFLIMIHNISASGASCVRN